MVPRAWTPPYKFSLSLWNPELHCCTHCLSHVSTPAVSLGSSQPGSWPRYATETTALLVNKHLLRTNPRPLSGSGHCGLIPLHWTLCGLGISAPHPGDFPQTRLPPLLMAPSPSAHPSELCPCRQSLGGTILFLNCTLQRSWFYLRLCIYHLVFTISTARTINWFIPISHIYNCIYNFFFCTSEGLVRTLQGMGLTALAGSKRENA